jgi:hypothetical protein
VNQGILGDARVRGGAPVTIPASRAEALAGFDNGRIITPQTLHLSRRGTGRAWFWEFFHDFAMTSGGGVGDIGTDGGCWFNQSSGAGSFANVTTFGLRPDNFAGRMAAGFAGLGTGTTTTGRGGFDSTSGVTTHRFDTGTTFTESLVYLPNLADATDDYIFRIGYAFGTGALGEGVSFEYNRSLSTNWNGMTVLNGVPTRLDTGIPVEAAKWIILRARWTGTVMSFQVNDLPTVATATTAIRPDGSSRIGAHIIKTAGTTSRSAIIDYIYARHDFDRERTYT